MTSPVAAYNFDEASGPVLDVTGNGHDWALNNNAVRSPTGLPSGGLSKNGLGFVVVGSTPFIGTNAWTVMFNQQGLGNGVWWMRLLNTAANTGSGILDVGSGIKLRLRKGGANIETTPVAPPGDGGMHHYAMTYDGSVGRLYVDGTLVGTTATATAPLDAVDVIDMMEFTLTNAFRDNLRFYTTALSQSEIDSLKTTPVEAETAVDAVLSGSLPTFTAALTALALASGGVGGALPELSGGLATSAQTAATVGGTLPGLTGTFTSTSPASGVLSGGLPQLTGSLLDFVPSEDVRRLRELERQRKVTRRFILAKPTWIELTPRADVRTASGATVNSDGPKRVSQMFRLIPMGHTERPVTSTSGVDAGVQRRYDFTLLGEHGAIVEPNDWWEDDNGQRWQVDSLVHGHGYEVKAMITSFGGNP